MKSIIISSNSSGGGKTTVTLGLMKALINRGISVQGYKVGPDYIDTAFHEHITKKASRNLDLYLMGEKGLKASYARGEGQYGIVEGVMGLYDGKGITSEYSTAAVSKLLKLPLILVLTPKAQSVTLCAEISGLIDFEQIDVAGIILNNINENYYKLLKTIIEKNFCGKVKVFGYLPKDESLNLKSRHLGLVQSSEVKDLDEKIQKCSELLEKYVQIDELLRYFSETQKFEDSYHLENRKLKIAVAKDKAFSFYYKENLELLEELGEVQYFSPLKDKALPENIDFLYLGGGYPEIFREELSSNKTLLSSINNALNKGTKCYAECGGLMYLMDSIEHKDMVGFLKGSAYMGTKLYNFGYAEIEVEVDNHIIPKGIKINCHEFHKSYIKTGERRIYKLIKDTYSGEQKKWKCGYLKNNTLAAYAHVHFFGNVDFIRHLIT
ncbi:cobyrinate a,c-diamide synthase [Clostridium sp. WILCCON 0269]|uniref:Cobyrinate a,c-diamide synthase n=1 Tax=Candidatus Clostridium eludens TaxID=3381663 RepID=A0ABW8SHL3_9CLOT